MVIRSLSQSKSYRFLFRFNGFLVLRFFRQLRVTNVRGETLLVKFVELFFSSPSQTGISFQCQGLPALQFSVISIMFFAGIKVKIVKLFVFVHLENAGICVNFQSGLSSSTCLYLKNCNEFSELNLKLKRNIHIFRFASDNAANFALWALSGILI